MYNTNNINALRKFIRKANPFIVGNTEISLLRKKVYFEKQFDLYCKLIRKDKPIVFQDLEILKIIANTETTELMDLPLDFDIFKIIK